MISYDKNDPIIPILFTFKINLHINYDIQLLEGDCVLKININKKAKGNHQKDKLI